MKPVSKTEIKLVAILFVVATVMLAGATGLGVQIYLRSREFPWEQSFRTKKAYLDFMNAFEGFIIALPAMAILCLVGAVTLFRALARIPDEKKPSP